MGFCTKCGAPLNEGSSFCTQCGASVNTASGAAPQQEAPNFNNGYTQQPQQPKADPAQYQVLQRPVLDRGLTAIVGYISVIGFIIAMVGGDRKDPYAKSHLNNALIILICSICSGVIYSVGAALAAVGYGFGLGYYGYGYVSPGAVVGIIFMVIGFAALVFTIVMWFFGLIRACKGNNKPIPVFGKITLLK